jgi:hypothetical protein
MRTLKIDLKFSNEVSSVGPIGPTGPTGPAGIVAPVNTFICDNFNTININNSGLLITSGEYAQYATVGIQLYIKSSSPGYLTVLTNSIVGDQYYLTVQNTINSGPVSFSVDDSVAIVGIQSNENVEIVQRGNPGMGSPLELSSFDIVHHYTSAENTNSIDISTTMVENGVYELFFNVNGGNNTMRLYPNYNQSLSATTFYNVYQNSNEDPAINYSAENANAFYNNYVTVASYGWDPVGKITIYNQTTGKKVRYESGDTTAIITGGGYWTNGSGFSFDSLSNINYNTNTIWKNVGTLTFNNSANWNIWVKRIA